MNEKTHPKQLRALLHVFPLLFIPITISFLLCPSLSLLFPPIPLLAFVLLYNYVVVFSWKGLSIDHHVLIISSVSGTEGVRFACGILLQKVSTAVLGVFQMWRQK